MKHDFFNIINWIYSCYNYLRYEHWCRSRSNYCNVTFVLRCHYLRGFYYNIIIYVQFIRFYTDFIKLFVSASLKTKNRYAREKSWRALPLTATFTCSRSKSIMQIAQSQKSMRKSRGGVDSSVVRAKLSSRCHVQDATCKSMFRQRKPGKQRFYDVAAGSPTVYPASSLHIFSSLWVWRIDFITAADRIVNVR